MKRIILFTDEFYGITRKVHTIRDKSVLSIILVWFMYAIGIFLDTFVLPFIFLHSLRIYDDRQEGDPFFKIIWNWED